MDRNSSNSTRSGKPGKPRPDFPLFVHKSGRWAKKVRKPGTKSGWGFAYFGKVADDPDGVAAEALWEKQKDDLLAGRTPREERKDTLLLGDLVNEYLNAKRRLRDSGEIGLRTFNDYYRTCERVIAAFGKGRAVDDITANDFGKLRATLAKTRGPVALGNEITRVKMIFTFGYDQGLIQNPIRYGQSFNKPSKKTIRKARAENGKRLFEREELLRLLDSADTNMKAMILLGINCGYGNTDLANLKFSHLDLDGGWADYSRPKTGVERRAKLWDETVSALRGVTAQRPQPKSHADKDCVFLTPRGERYVRVHKDSRTDTLARQFGNLLRKLHINGRKGLGIYTLRHMTQTVGDNARDPVAISHVMGHVDNSMSGVYREHIEDERLEEVANVIHDWLFPSEEGGAE